MIFIVHIPTNAILSDNFLADMGDQQLEEGIKMGVYKKIELTENQASEYNVLGLEEDE